MFTSALIVKRMRSMPTTGLLEWLAAKAPAPVVAISGVAKPGVARSCPGRPSLILRAPVHQGIVLVRSVAIVSRIVVSLEHIAQDLLDLLHVRIFQ